MFLNFREGSSLPISSDTAAICRSAMNDINLMEKDKKKVEFFNISGFGMYHAGSIWKSSILGQFDKALVGIPIHFNEVLWKSSFQKKTNVGFFLF